MGWMIEFEEKALSDLERLDAHKRIYQTDVELGLDHFSLSCLS